MQRPNEYGDNTGKQNARRPLRPVSYTHLAKILVLHGQRLGAGSLSDREYCDHYRTLYRLGQSLGVTVAQENVRLFRSASPEFIAVMRRELGDECACAVSYTHLDVYKRQIYEVANKFGVDFTEIVTGIPAKLDRYHICLLYTSRCV